MSQTTRARARALKLRTSWLVTAFRLLLLTLFMSSLPLTVHSQTYTGRGGPSKSTNSDTATDETTARESDTDNTSDSNTDENADSDKDTSEENDEDTVVFEKPPRTSPPPLKAPLDVSQVECRAFIEQEPSLIKKALGTVGIDDQNPISSQYAVIRTLCRNAKRPANEEFNAKAKIESNLPKCINKQSRLCIAHQKESAGFKIGKDFLEADAWTLVQYKHFDNVVELRSSLFDFKVTVFEDREVENPEWMEYHNDYVSRYEQYQESRGSRGWRSRQIARDALSGDTTYDNTSERVVTTKVEHDISVQKQGGVVNLGGGTKVLSCEVFVSGGENNIPSAHCSGLGCQPTGVLDVANGGLIFSAALKGVPEELSTPATVQWEGGPDQRGVWESPPVLRNTTVRAKLISKDGQSAECAVAFKQQGEGYTIRLSKHGDCTYYRTLRDYYFLDKSDQYIQTTGYSEPLRILGFDAQYGRSAPDIPFRGVYNSAFDKNKNVTIRNGSLVLPSESDRLWTAPIVVARQVKPDGMALGRTLFWGRLNTENYQFTQLTKLDQSVSDEDLVVFQFYLAKAELQGGRDVRGHTGTPLYSFVESKNGSPYDRVIPVVNESCMPIFQVQTPSRKDKPLPAVLKDATNCTFSKPFRVGDLKGGRVNLTVTHMTAEAGDHLFPLDLIKGNASPDKNIVKTKTINKTASGGGNVACWVANPASLGSATWSDSITRGTASTGSRSTSSSSTSSTTTRRERVPANECSTQMVNTKTVTTTTTTTNTQVANQLAGTLGYRYNMAAFEWGAAFGCAVSNNWSGRSVYGVVPSGAALTGHMAGAPYGSSSPSLGHVSCVIGSRQASILDILQEAFSTPSIRLSSYTFNKSQAPSTSVRMQRFHVRPWGYTLSNLASDAAATFDAPMCPGSQFAYDNVSLSWSPLILDLKGKGIHISRKFKYSVPFDIKGTGYLSYVDWPTNPEEVAFLVLPNSEGQVESIKELFGDDRSDNGFEKLISYDLNQDQRIDKADNVYSKLRLWSDLNRDGKADKGELTDLASQGVLEIKTSYVGPGRLPAEEMTAERKTLVGLYYNSKSNRYQNIEDHYFYEYVDSERVKHEVGAVAAQK